MKKFAVVAILVILSSMSVFAQTTSEPMTVTATLAPKYVVTVSGETPVVLAVAGDSVGTTVATVNLYTNKKSWAISLLSDNGGKLKSTTQYEGSDLYIPYSISLSGSLNGDEMTLFGLTKTPYAGWGTGTPVVKESLTDRTSPGVAAGDAFIAKITYEAEDGSWVSDLTYTDTVTITMTAN